MTSARHLRNCLKRAVAPILISSLSAWFQKQVRVQERWREKDCRRETDRRQQQCWFFSPCLFRWLVRDCFIPGAVSHPIYLLFHIFTPFLIPQVQDGCFPQPANTFRADNLGILCVWYTYHIAAQLPWCTSNIYLKKKEKNQTLPNLFPPQSSLLKLLTSPSVGNLQDADLFVYSFIFGSITLTASKEGGEDIWENNL